MQILQNEYSQQKSYDAMMQYRYLAWTYWGAGDFSKSVLLLSRAVEISRAINGPDSETTLVCLDELAISYLKLGSISKAETLYREILSHGNNPMPHERWRLLAVRTKLAHCCVKTGKIEEARELLKTTIIDGQREKPPILVPEAKLELAEIYLKEREFDKAGTLLKQSIDESISLHDKDLIQKVAIAASELFVNKKDYSSAENILLKALNSMKTGRPADDVFSILHFKALANCYEKQDRLSDAQKYNKKASELSLKSIAEPWPAASF